MCCQSECLLHPSGLKMTDMSRTRTNLIQSMFLEKRPQYPQYLNPPDQAEYRGRAIHIREQIPRVVVVITDRPSRAPSKEHALSPSLNHLILHPQLPLHLYLSLLGLHNLGQTRL